MMMKRGNKVTEDFDMRTISLVMGDVELEFYKNQIGHFDMEVSKGHYYRNGGVYHEDIIDSLELEICADRVGEVEYCY